MIDYWPLALLAITLLFAAIQDARTFRIANIYSLLVAGLFGVSLLVGGVPPDLWQHGVHFLIALFVGMGLFALGWIGGGDAKLYAACALWFNLAAGIQLLFFVSFSGLLLLVVMLLVGKWLRSKSDKQMSDSADSKKQRMRLPYGIAIAAGTLACLATNEIYLNSEPEFDPTAVAVPEDLTDSRSSLPTSPDNIQRLILSDLT